MASTERGWRANSGFLRTAGAPAILSPSGELAERLAEITNAGWGFFAFPEPMKRRSGQAELPSGYREARGRYSPSFAAVQRCETFTVRRCDDAAVRSRLHGSAVELYDSMFAALDELDELAQAILLEAGVVSATAGQSQLRVARATADSSPHPYLEEPHVDAGLLTITTATAGGLVIRDQSGRDAPVSVRSGDLVVIPGRRLGELSQGRFQPLTYAVRAPIRCGERLSITYIVDVDQSAR